MNHVQGFLISALWLADIIATEPFHSMPKNTYMRNLLRRATRLLPTGKLGRFTLYVFTLRMFVFVAQQTLLYFSSKALADTLSGWGTFFTFILTLCFTVLALRWFRNRFLWKVRNRLIVTYMFIGVVPVSLVVVMAGLSGYLFFNQFATSQARGEIESEVKKLEMVNNGLAREFSERLDHGDSLDIRLVESLSNVRHQSERFPGWQIILWQEGKPKLLYGGGSLAREVEEPEWGKGDYQGIVVDENKFFLRAVDTVTHKGHAGHLVSTVPLNGAMLEKMATGLGAIQIFIARAKATGDTSPDWIRMQETDDSGAQSSSKELIFSSKPDVIGGKVPDSKRGKMDIFHIVSMQRLNR